MKETIPYSQQTIDEDDIRSVADVLRSPYLTTGPKVREFEQAVARYVSVAEAVAFSSGTAALHGALTVADVGPGDEVLVPTLSFLASANAILYVGGRPVFVDSELGRFNLDLEDLERKVTPRTKAIVVVHFAGEPVDIERVHAIARKYGLLMIEDAAHAFGAAIHGRRIGGFSDMTIFSFHPVKHITTGEGGMVTTNRPELAARLRRFRHHGIDVDVVQRNAQQHWRYDMVDLGYNYRLTDIQSALGLSQLKKSDAFLKQRTEIAAIYNRAFAENSTIIRPPLVRNGGVHSWHLYIIRLNCDRLRLSRDEVFRLLQEQGIGVNVHYRPIHLHSYYERLGWKHGDCPNSESIFESILSLPIFPSMTDAMIQRVIQAVNDICAVSIQK